MACPIGEPSITSLLDLPAEIRARIWIETLGGRHIHIWDKCHTGKHKRTPMGRILDHDICTAPGKLRTDECHNVTSKELSALRLKPPIITNWDHNHTYCWKRKCEIMANDPRLDLTVLRINRQVHSETSEALMTTNTFCFDSGRVLSQFLMVYGPQRCRRIRYLYL